MAFLMSSCDLSNIRVGEIRMMYGSNEDGHISYNYSTFSGVENGSSEARAGQHISFEYGVTVDKGSLLIEWQNPDGDVVWRKDLIESESGNNAFRAEFTGNYVIVIQGKNAGGEFDISWKVE